MYRHRLEHFKSELYNCTCGKSFSRKDNLSRHKSKHKGGKLKVCSFSAKVFSRTSHLNQHVLTHKKNGYYKCSSCSNIYVHEGHHKSHLLNCKIDNREKQKKDKESIKHIVKNNQNPNVYDFAPYQLPKEMDNDLILCMMKDYLIM